MIAEGKRAQICAMELIPISASQVNDRPGEKTIQVSGVWISIPISSGEFKEKVVPGELVEQEFKGSVTNTEADFAASLHDLLSQSCLVKLKFTNGAERVVGTDQFPVLLTLEEAGTPAAFTLSFKRNSPELSKKLKSF